ncbi:hypothetical protein CJF32_00010785 [Rutstroemia sp. NJR-2017a WRK4]|nr:hypothetical protein CJF32_00010785 [Rutstroemia sp. NJR-2017a WRK4]
MAAAPPSRSVIQSRLPLFTLDTDTELVLYPYIYDIQVVLLRTRYYYTKYIVYRLFLYKILPISSGRSFSPYPPVVNTLSPTFSTGCKTSLAFSLLYILPNIILY